MPGPNPFRWHDLTTSDIFKSNKVVFSLPGAFTPTCSSNHLPRYEELFKEFRAQENVFLLPDGNGEFTRKMGMLVDQSNLGFGMRSWRYSMLVNNGEIENIVVEPNLGDSCPVDRVGVPTPQRELQA